MNTGRNTIMTNTGCKYPGKPEPCEAYREAMEVLAEAEKELRIARAAFMGIRLETDNRDIIECCSAKQKDITKVLTRIDQLREKE